jgi:hypothetical protein
MKHLLFGLITIILAACAPSVTTKLIKTYSSLDFNEEVTVIDITEVPPESATEIGTVKIGDTGFSTDCGWGVVIEEAKKEARKAGGNAIKIIEHFPPSVFGSSCDRITALILKIDDPKYISKMKEKISPIVDSTWNYAKLYVYRPGGTGFLISYDLYLGDSVLCTVNNSSTREIKITKEGMYSLWARTEVKTEIPIYIQFGREYYLKCSLAMGILVGQPQLQLVDYVQGKSQYNSIKKN